MHSNSAWSSLIACVNALAKGAETGPIVVAAAAAEAAIAVVIVAAVATAEVGNQLGMISSREDRGPIHRTNFKPESCGLPPASLNVISLADAIESWPTSALWPGADRIR